MAAKAEIERRVKITGDKGFVWYVSTAEWYRFRADPEAADKQTLYNWGVKFTELDHPDIIL
jgi:hypothetical protein